MGQLAPCGEHKEQPQVDAGKLSEEDATCPPVLVSSSPVPSTSVGDIRSHDICSLSFLSNSVCRALRGFQGFESILGVINVVIITDSRGTRRPKS